MYKKLVLDGEIKKFDEAIPIGNGVIGALIYRSNPLRVSVDRNDVWDLRDVEWRNRDNFNIKHQMELIKEGDYQELRKSFNASGVAYPTKLPVNKFELHFESDKNVIKNSVRLTDGLAEFLYDDGTIVKSFISLASNVGFIKANAPYTAKYDVLRNEKTKETDHLSASVCDLGFDPSYEWEKDGVSLSTQKTLDGNEYSVGFITEKQGDEYVTVFGVGYSYQTENYLENFIALLHDALKVGFDKEFTAHKKEWKKYNEKSYITLPKREKALQKQWDLGNYFFRSNCKADGLPIALQGVWTADNNSLPPWRGDFHFNTNVEMTYWNYMKANHADVGINLIDFLWEKRPVFRDYAKKFFLVDGIVVPGCMDAAGKVMGGWAPYSLASTMGCWAAQVFDEYYRFTDDKEFLKNRAFPFFKEIAEAITGLLSEKNGKNGNLHLPLSSSPEIYDDTIRAYLQPESNCDLALIRYAYTTLIDYCKILGEDASEYENILSRLDYFHAWDNAGLEFSAVDKYLGHTNLAHTLSIYPLRLLDYDNETDKELIDKTVSSLEWYGTGSWVGHTYVWMANHYALTRNGNAAAYYLNDWCTVFTSVNGFHLNGDYKRLGATQFHYRPFTLEANFGFNDALQEMLIKDRKGYLELFPAIPDWWIKEDVSFKLAAYGGIIVECKFSNGKIVKLNITAKTAKNIKIKSKYLDEELNLSLKAGVNKIISEE